MPGQWLSDDGTAAAEEILKLTEVYGYEFFATRAYAARIRAMADVMLAGAERLVVDFTGVEAITGQFADELVAQLKVRYGPRVVTVGMNEYVADTVGLAIKRRVAA
jgi:hypothetical protein